MRIRSCPVYTVCSRSISLLGAEGGKLREGGRAGTTFPGLGWRGLGEGRRKQLRCKGCQAWTVRGWKGDQEKESQGMGSSSFCLMGGGKKWSLGKLDVESSLDPDHGYLGCQARKWESCGGKWGISRKDFKSKVLG